MGDGKKEIRDCFQLYTISMNKSVGFLGSGDYCKYPYILVEIGEAALEIRDFETSEKCSLLFFSMNPAKDQVLMKLFLVLLSSTVY